MNYRVAINWEGYDDDMDDFVLYLLNFPSLSFNVNIETIDDDVDRIEGKQSISLNGQQHIEKNKGHT